MLIQISQDVPHPSNNSPIDLNNTADVLLYIVLPLVVIILYIIWRRYRK